MLPIPRLLVFLLGALCAASSLFAAAERAPRVFLLDLEQLDRARNGGAPTAVKKLVEEADKLLAATPRSVLEKTITPASGDKHDYFSMGPYWWPDPAKPDGLPYIRRDGEVNPEARRNSDVGAFAQTCAAIEVLGTAFYVTGDARYAEKAATLARVWFLDPATRMNPNFQHAQAIPGITTGRGIGIIEGQNLMRANEGLALLGQSRAWSEADRTAMRAWNEQFYTWLTTSKNAMEEKGWYNNHGSWYDAQTSHLALVIGRDDDARRLLTEGLQVRVAKQIEPDGSMPHELERTRSLAYSIYNLEALFLCARLGELVGVDWWRFATPDGRSLGAALRYVAPYVDAKKPWPKKDLADAKRTRLIPLLRRFTQRVDDPVLKELLRAASPDDTELPWRSLVEEYRG